MKAKTVLRIISLLMFIVAVVFVFIAVSCPTCGRVFYIGSFRVGVEEMHAFYNGYVIVMILLFLLSFFVKKKEKS